MIHWDHKLIAGGGILLLALSLLAMQWNHWWATNLLTNFHPHLAVLGIAVLTAGVIWRRWLHAGIGAAIVAANLGLMVSQLPAANAIAPASVAASLRVMTLNVLFDNRDVASLRSQLVRLNPDVVLLQEVTRRWDSDLTVMADLYPYRMELTYTRDLLDQHGTVILSRFPFTETARPDIADVAGRLTAARVSVDGHQVWVASTHMVKPNTLDGQVLQRRQMADLARWVQHTDGPVVLGGDFNATPYTPQLDQLVESSGLATDAQAAPWWRAALGTYPSWLPVLSLKIDHIMTRGATIAEAEIVAVPGSDHKAVIATITLPVVL